MNSTEYIHTNNDKKNISMIAQFPPPIHGLSKAVDTIYHSYLKKEYNFEKIDITNNKLFFFNLFKIWKSKADTCYFTISQSKGGNIRDLVILHFIIRRKKKSIVHLHGGYFGQLVESMNKFQKKFNYKYLKKVDAVIVLSESLKSNFQNIVENNRIHIVSNCVDDEFLISDEEFKVKKEVLKSQKVYRVLYLSNFIESKGYRKVLEMANIEKKLCEKGKLKKFHFDFAGKFFDSKDEKIFLNYIKEKNLEEYITYHGVVTGNKKRELLKKCSIFILLTTYQIEGQPISIIEAMGNGLFIITTKHAGIPDIVVNGKNGLIFEKSCEVVSVYEEMKNITPTLYYQIMLNNREECLNYYTESNYLNNIKEIFDLN
ncbi:glycosyltransferase [Ureibacillus aquaedulcis]|uniref:Glycosyltransferase n=1 Tax=Ureibacillus aquaedulcis TaxID=3058421 RepID=A0ABT8GUL7_9BACL|nr:glycosyltransferase [Ureibacillus sp. BA0131]MDN4495107.1 glycosyltransferase [Ureibacillus sp. BA0131]